MARVLVVGIGSVVRLREILRRWKARATSSSDSPEAPEGHVMVRVSSSERRFAVPAAQLNHPVFRELLALAAEEYGFNHDGPLTVPCDETVFEDMLQRISRSTDLEGLRRSSSFSCYCYHTGLRGGREPLPLLTSSWRVS